jgi:hypothetical protein
MANNVYTNRLYLHDLMKSITYNTYLLFINNLKKMKKFHVIVWNWIRTMTLMTCLKNLKMIPLQIHQYFFFDIIKNCRLWPHLTNIASTHIHHPLGVFNNEHNEKLNFPALLQPWPLDISLFCSYQQIVKLKFLCKLHDFATNLFNIFFK